MDTVLSLRSASIHDSFSYLFISSTVPRWLEDSHHPTWYPPSHLASLSSTRPTLVRLVIYDYVRWYGFDL
jgi:hypothetical protein